MNYPEFQIILRQALPFDLTEEYGMEFPLIHMQDLCYVEGPFIYYLNAMDLSDSIEKRYQFYTHTSTYLSLFFVSSKQFEGVYTLL